MKFAVTKVAKFIAVLVVLAASADARPSSQRSISTRLGGDCDLIDGINYECTSGLKCDTMPGRSQKTCINVSNIDGACNIDHSKCASGLTCSIEPYQSTGTCISSSNTAPDSDPASGYDADSKEFVTRRPYSKQIYGTDEF